LIKDLTFDLTFQIEINFGRRSERNSILIEEESLSSLLSRDTVVSRAKFTRSARRTVYLYARPKVETSRNYQISITTESIELIIISIDRAYPNYI